MLKYLVPQIALADLQSMICVAVTGALIAGVYGALHDQFTYAISSEYFTKVKFTQFRCADLGLGDHVFASTIGFLATSCVGFVAAWFLARRLVPRQRRERALRQIRNGFVCVFACGVFFGLMGYVFGILRGPDADFSSWEWAFRQYQIEDEWSFVRVAYIHNGGYLGGFIGLIVALSTLRPSRLDSTDATELPNTERTESR